MGNLVEQKVGPYRIIRPLGKGGHADVYLARHKDTGVPSALKVPNIRNLANGRERFLHEAYTHVHLNHPHIIHGREFGTDDNTPFLAMDYAMGNVWQHFKNKRLPLVTIVHYTKQLADALQYLHISHRLHQDVKPENILIGWSNNVLLCDFSLVMTCKSRYVSLNTVIGTPAYRSPEQCSGYSCEASDQYSLGLVVYEWLSGFLPFNGSVSDVNFQQKYVSPPRLHEMFPGLSLEVEQVVFKALAKDPCQRFANVWEFSQALDLASRSVPSSISRNAFVPLQPLVVATVDSSDAIYRTTPSP